VIVEQRSDPTAGSTAFDDTLSRLLNDEQCRATMAQSMAGLAHPDAAARVVELLLANG
jgi:UDP-N-acetylglucosamine:LPS N-acetylglucosamine transferase